MTVSCCKFTQLQPATLMVMTLQFSNEKTALSVLKQLKGSVKEANIFHNYETEKITRKATDAAEYIELFGSFT